MSQESLQHSKFNVPEEASSCKETQVISETSPLLSQSGLASMELSALYAAQCPSVPDLITTGASSLMSTKASDSSTWPLGINDSACLVTRGRPLRRTNRPRNPLERAESRKHMRDATVEVNVRSIKSRYCRSVTFFEDPADPCAAFEDELFEPCPHDPICDNVSEIMTQPGRNVKGGVDTPSPVAGVVRTNSNKFHDISRLSICSTTSLLVESKGCTSPPALTTETVLAPTPRFSHAECVFTKSSKIWCPMRNPDRRLSVMSLIPPEILSQIYNALSPTDFNAARHTCRLWFIYSLDRAILETMLKRGGWSTSIPEKLEYQNFLHRETEVNDEWLMSKRLSRECALGPDWTGNGLCPATDSLKCLYTKHHSKSNPFIHTSTTDFSEIGVHYPAAENRISGIIFTVSTCGRFLMVAHGCLIYVFELNCNQDSASMVAGQQNSTLRPVTSVICPRRVLACSMDTSSNRHAIAVLLDGRMGLVCDLTGLKSHSQSSSVNRYKMSQDTSSSRTQEYRNRVSISSSQACGLHRSQPVHQFVFPVIAAEASQTSFASELRKDIWEDTHTVQSVASAADVLQSTGRMLFGQSGFQSRATNLFPPSSIPVESSVPTIYAPLCSTDDMPRSVALCPQRRCVAFGCSSGIELHWVDALTGQDLNRWFPLAAPSDYLYFLPPRPGVDSAKKLRLISSAGRPDESSVIAQKFGVNRSGDHGSLFKGAKSSKHEENPSDVASASRNGFSTPSRDNSDHYRAVPLSDGYHILFTDPSTGLLCLGCDAPIGGPTKLLRKIWFAGPQGQGSPVTYAGGGDLRWGVRVVVAYGSKAEHSIWLFSVPPDVFTESLTEQGNINLPYMGATYETESSNRDWIPWWSKSKLGNSPEPSYGASHNMIIRHDGLWPIQVRGQEIGKCHEVVDLAIDAGPQMTIWAFGKDGSAKTWKIDCASLDTTPERTILVMRDGSIRTSDASGDIHMVDSPSTIDESMSPTAESQVYETYDGSTSLQNSGILLSKQKQWSRRARCSDSLDDPVILDADGDVLMADLPLPSPENPYERWPPAWNEDGREEIPLAHGAGHQFFDPNPVIASVVTYVEQEQVDGRDLIDALTGIARIEIDIR